MTTIKPVTTGPAKKITKHERGIVMLKDFGLTENEAIIYTDLLERGVDVGGSKIALGTGLHRQYVYLAMEKLLELGLIETISHGKRSRYKAVSTLQIEKLARRRIVDAEEIVRELNTFSTVGHEQDFEVLQGIRAIQRYEMEYAERALNDEQEFIIGGNATCFEQIMGELLDEYTGMKDRKHMQVLYLGGNATGTERYKQQTSFTSRIIPGFPHGETHTVIRKDTVLFFSFLNPPLVYVIKSPVVADYYKQFFMMLWNMAKNQEG